MYFEVFTGQSWEKRSAHSRKGILRNDPDKYRKRGELDIRPAFAPVLRIRPYAAVVSAYLKSGRQNLAALGTTTGQNLAAVGSSHSLTETVDLGTMTAAGLVGTLHTDTPPMMKFYAQ